MKYIIKQSQNIAFRKDRILSAEKLQIQYILYNNCMLHVQLRSHSTIIALRQARFSLQLKLEHKMDIAWNLIMKRLTNFVNASLKKGDMTTQPS